MDKSPIYITAYECVSPAGLGLAAQLDALFAGRSALSIFEGQAQGRLDLETKDRLRACLSETWLRYQDPLIHLTILALRGLTSAYAIAPDSGCIIGSSRGPTTTLEHVWQEFAATGASRAHASPTSTASALSSAVARELKLSGPSVSLSAACATGLQAVIQAAVSIQGGLASRMVAGGAEYANTAFTLAMLRATKVMASGREGEAFPCRPGEDSRKGMVLSEGAALLYLETEPKHRPLAEIVGWGAASEQAGLTGVSPEGDALFLAIERALKNADIQASCIDFIVGHGAGTLKGDEAEMRAYARSFPMLPPLVWHKWCFGHMLGASAAQSLILACEHLRSGLLPPHPYFSEDHPAYGKRILNQSRYALISSMGFGGNACAVVLKNPLSAQAPSPQRPSL